MTLSDLISFIGIILAIIAFIGEKERLFVINKFDKIDVTLIVATFLFINFLLFYDWWRILLPYLAYFEFTNFPLPQTWVYIITILFISWLLFKIFYSSFPKTNQKRALKFYQQLQQKKDYAFLFNLIMKNDKKQLLDKNDNSEYINDLVKMIFLDREFLFKTYNFNYVIFNEILSTRHSIDNTIIDNYIESQLYNPNSFVYHSTHNEIENKKFYSLIKKTKHLNSFIIYIIRNNTIPLNKLLDFILNVSIDIEPVNDIYRIVLKEILDRKDSIALQLFLIEYLKYIKSNNHNINESFKEISLTLIESINYIANISVYENIIKLYLKIIMFMTNFNCDDTKRIMEDTYRTNRNDNSKLLISKVYSIYYDFHSGESDELEIILNKIYN